MIKRSNGNVLDVEVRKSEKGKRESERGGRESQERERGTEAREREGEGGMETQAERGDTYTHTEGEVRESCVYPCFGFENHTYMLALINKSYFRKCTT